MGLDFGFGFSFGVLGHVRRTLR